MTSSQIAQVLADGKSSWTCCRHYKWLLPTYDSFKAEIYRADFARQLYLHRCKLCYSSLLQIAGAHQGQPALVYVCSPVCHSWRQSMATHFGYID